MKRRGPSAWTARFVRVRSAPRAAPGGAARPRPAARWLRGGEIVLLVIGLAFLGEVLIGVASARWHQARDESTLREAEKALGATNTPGPGPVGRPAPESSKPTGPVVLCRIEIPRVGVSAIVREGDDDATLAVAVGHVPGTARPGEPGNVVLAGHRDSFFRGLRRIRQGDRIRLRAPGHRVEYRVDSTEIVGPEETRVLARTADDRLTLVTCFPFGFVGNAPKRFVVTASRVVPKIVDRGPPATSVDLEVGDDREVVAGDPREP